MFLVDGYSTIVVLGGVASGTFFRAREVQPGELDGGGPIDTSTMLNAFMLTQTHKSLRNVGATKLIGQYDPFTLAQLISVINVVLPLTTIFPDGTAMAWWGWINKFTPQPLKIGEFPLAELELIPTNRASNGAEYVQSSPAFGQPIYVPNSRGVLVR